MKQNFWKELQKPIMALAPMANVTDAAFRRVIAKYSKVKGGYPYVTYTEFVSADGLFLGDERARSILMHDLIFTEAERPIVAQFFTAKPELMEKAAKLSVELGFDGIDINMGCPDRGVEKQGAGAALIKNPKLARELIRAAKRGAGELPVSVKTRIGYNKNELETWLPELLEEDPSAVILHLRTRKEMSKVPAHWDVMKDAVKMRDVSGKETLLLGNGDIQNLDDAFEKVKDSGADGAMLGKAIFGNPSLFSNSYELENKDGEDLEFIQKRLEVMIEHTKLFEELLGDIKNFAIMKKHYKAYVEGFPGAKELRAKLMEAENAKEVEKTTSEFLK